MDLANLGKCTNDEDYKKRIKDAGSRIVIVHFEAEWAEECTVMNEVFKELAKTYKHTVFLRVEAEALPDITMSYQVDSVPTFLILKEGKVVDKVEGADASKLSKSVKYYATSFVAPIIKPEPYMTLEERLQKLIKSSPVMLFMKGSPSSPKCGFSRQIIEILDHNKIKYSTFDILTDNEVRQGLKKYSDWPTYPQLYGDGELIGGVDIVKELSESGELVDSLPKTEDINIRLKNLTTRSPIMVFMKGDPKAPRCKFSKALMAIFSRISLQFDSFDILEDEEVRQELKKFSNWPTYPQIYVNGEFVGGVDIIKELDETGELISTLTPSTA